MSDSGERPSVRAIDLSEVSRLRAEVDALARPPVKSPALSWRDQCKRKAIASWKRALEVIGPARTMGAREIGADESTMRDWESPGARQVLPAWALFALPRQAKLEIVRALLDEIDSEGLRRAG